MINPPAKSASGGGASAGHSNANPVSTSATATTISTINSAKYMDEYRRILETVGTPNYPCIRSLFQGNISARGMVEPGSIAAAPPAEVMPAIQVSFELFESVQNRFSATKHTLDRTKEELHSRNQQFTQVQTALNTLKETHALLEKRMQEADERNTLLHQTIAKQEVTVEQLRKEVGLVHTEMDALQEKLIKREDELHATQNRVAEGLVLLSQKEATIASLRKELGKHGLYHRKTRSRVGPTEQGLAEGDNVEGEDQGEGYTQEALRGIAEDVEGRTHEARMKLSVAEMEAKLKRVEEEKKFILLQHHLYLKHVEGSVAAYENLCMEKEDAVAGHKCVTSPFMLASTLYHIPGNLNSDLDSSVQNFTALALQSHRAVERLSRIDLDKGSKLKPGLDQCIDAQRISIQAFNELVNFVRTFEKEISQNVLTMHELREEWKRADVPKFTNGAASLLSSAVTQLNSSLVQIMQKENEYAASISGLEEKAANNLQRRRSSTKSIPSAPVKRREKGTQTSNKDSDSKSNFSPDSTVFDPDNTKSFSSETKQAQGATEDVPPLPEAPTAVVSTLPVQSAKETESKEVQTEESWLMFPSNTGDATPKAKMGADSQFKGQTSPTTINPDKGINSAFFPFPCPHCTKVIQTLERGGPLPTYIPPTSIGFGTDGLSKPPANKGGKPVVRPIFGGTETPNSEASRRSGQSTPRSSLPQREAASVTSNMMPAAKTEANPTLSSPTRAAEEILTVVPPSDKKASGELKEGTSALESIELVPSLIPRTSLPLPQPLQRKISDVHSPSGSYASELVARIDDLLIRTGVISVSDASATQIPIVDTTGTAITQRQELLLSSSLSVSSDPKQHTEMVLQSALKSLQGYEARVKDLEEELRYLRSLQFNYKEGAKDKKPTKSHPSLDPNGVSVDAADTGAPLDISHQQPSPVSSSVATDDSARDYGTDSRRKDDPDRAKKGKGTKAKSPVKTKVPKVPKAGGGGDGEGNSSPSSPSSSSSPKQKRDKRKGPMDKENAQSGGDASTGEYPKNRPTKGGDGAAFAVKEQQQHQSDHATDARKPATEAAEEGKKRGESNKEKKSPALRPSPSTKNVNSPKQKNKPEPETNGDETVRKMPETETATATATEDKKSQEIRVSSADEAGKQEISAVEDASGTAPSLTPKTSQSQSQMPSQRQSGAQETPGTEEETAVQRQKSIDNKSERPASGSILSVEDQRTGSAKKSASVSQSSNVPYPKADKSDTPNDRKSPETTEIHRSDSIDQSDSVSVPHKSSVPLPTHPLPQTGYAKPPLHTTTNTVTTDTTISAAYKGPSPPKMDSTVPGGIKNTRNTKTTQPGKLPPRTTFGGVSGKTKAPGQIHEKENEDLVTPYHANTDVKGDIKDLVLTNEKRDKLPETSRSATSSARSESFRVLANKFPLIKLDPSFSNYHNLKKDAGSRWLAPHTQSLKSGVEEVGDRGRSNYWLFQSGRLPNSNTLYPVENTTSLQIVGEGGNIPISPPKATLVTPEPPTHRGEDVHHIPAPTLTPAPPRYFGFGQHGVGHFDSILQVKGHGSTFPAPNRPVANFPERPTQNTDGVHLNTVSINHNVPLEPTTSQQFIPHFPSPRPQLQPQTTAPKSRSPARVPPLIPSHTNPTFAQSAKGPVQLHPSLHVAPTSWTTPPPRPPVNGKIRAPLSAASLWQEPLPIGGYIGMTAFPPNASNSWWNRYTTYVLSRVLIERQKRRRLYPGDPNIQSNKQIKVLLLAKGEYQIIGKGLGPRDVRRSTGYSSPVYGDRFGQNNDLYARRTRQLYPVRYGALEKLPQHYFSSNVRAAGERDNGRYAMPYLKAYMAAARARRWSRMGRVASRRRDSNLMRRGCRLKMGSLRNPIDPVLLFRQEKIVEEAIKHEPEEPQEGENMKEESNNPDICATGSEVQLQKH